jgi:DNA-binding NtrC family response regulator
VSSKRQRRKILILEDEPSIRNVLFVLLAGLGCDGDVATNAEQALLTIRKHRYDAFLFDLRSTSIAPDEMVDKVTDIRPNLDGRILVITGDDSAPDAVERLDRAGVPHVTAGRVYEDLWSKLNMLRGFVLSPVDSASR